MFKKARKELHKLLSQWTFSLITRGITIPPDCVVNGEVTHYYTTADELSISPNKKTSTVWIKKKARWVGGRWFGPIFITEETNDLPKPGEILFGEITVANGSQKEFGRQKISVEKQCYKWWQRSGEPLYYLALIVLKGTSETENSLRSILRLSTGFDDLWILARIVLFNNIQCVVNLLQPSNTEKIKLQSKPVQFIHGVSVFLQDMSILSEFQKLVPDTLLEPLSVPTSLSLEESNNSRKFVGRKRRASTIEEYNPDYPSYDFSNRQPAGETSGFQKVIQTTTHKVSYAPQSPPYAPQSPPYAPQSPFYEPQSPPTLRAPSFITSTYPPLCDM